MTRESLRFLRVPLGHLTDGDGRRFQIRLPARPDVVTDASIYQYRHYHLFMCETYVYSMYETNDYVLMYETYAYSILVLCYPNYNIIFR